METIYDKLNSIFDNYDESTQKKFHDFFMTFKEYGNYRITTSKALDKNKEIGRFRVTFNYLMKHIEKDLYEMSEDELYGLVLKKEANTTHHRVLTRYYRYLQEHNLYMFKNKLFVVYGTSCKTDEDFYTREEWCTYANILLDLDNTLPRAFHSMTFARCWLFAILHLCIAWRRADILAMPALDNLLDIKKYTMKWFRENKFTLKEANFIIENTKEIVEQYFVLKTGTRKNFNIPHSMRIQVAIAIIIVEQWRRAVKQDKLFGTCQCRTGQLTTSFGKKFEQFSSRKANRTLLTLVDNMADELGANEVIRISSYMRAHKTNYYGFSDTTSIYLKANYSEKELNEITLQLYERGMFGWLYDNLLSLLSDHKRKFRYSDTNKIMLLKENIPAKTIDEISGLIKNQKMNKEKVLNELLNCSRIELKEKFINLIEGNLNSHQENVYCLNHSCTNKTKTDCMTCEYSIPTIYTLLAVQDELNDLCLKIKDNPPMYEYDKLRMINKILKLFSIIKDSMDYFGEDYVKQYISYDDIKSNLIESYKLIKGES